jgi:hypothetical protein
MNVALLSQPQRELRAYLQRVAGDGGTVETPGEASTFIRRLRSAGVLGSTVIAGVAGGVKAGTLYSIIGPDLDVTRGTVKNRVNRAGVLSEVASGVPATDFAGGVLRGTTVEPSSRNEIRNNTMQGAVVGSPGTLPTNWDLSSGTIVAEILQIGVLDGIEFIDIRYSGTASAGSIQQRFETSGVITATNNQNWTNSFWLQLIATPLPPTSYTGMTIQLGVSDINTVFTPIAGFNRYQFPITTASSGITSVIPAVRFTTIPGQSYDFTIRIGLPQMELSSVATSVIKTTGSAQTRNADVITKTGLGSVLPQTEGWVYAEVDLRVFGINRSIINLSDGTLNNRIQITLGGAGVVEIRMVSGGTTQFGTPEANIIGGTLRYFARWSLNGASLFRNGAKTVDVVSSITPPTTTILNIGQGAAGGIQLNDPIHSYAIGSGAITDAQAIQLTTL